MTFLFHSDALNVLISCVLFGCVVDIGVETDADAVFGTTECILCGLWYFLVELDVVSVCYARVESFIG